jgi:hypothetical protein
MKLGIMQPYFLPYIGYFQLIESVDKFIVYDNIKYTKKGWINRNRFLQNGKDVLFSLPLKKDSDFLDVRDRQISADFNSAKFLNQLREAYRKAPCFGQAFPLVESIVLQKETNLFKYLFNSIQGICDYVGITSELVVSSAMQIDHSLQNKDKVIALCKCAGANTYINAIGGQELYSKSEFETNGLALKFIKTRPFTYKQFDNEFVPWLSIVDLMMFNSREILKGFVSGEYDLV